jgi:ubiquitin-conjugating enzyme E2 variant
VRPNTSTEIRHDDVGLLTRLFEVACITSAVSLLVFHGHRFATTPGVLNAWTLALVLLAALFADLVSGLIHWGADTWGSETLPVIGRRLLRPFRVHHVNPDDFLRRDFLDTNGDVALLTTLFLLAALLIPLENGLGGMSAVFVVAFAGSGLPTNQVHQWAHMPTPPMGVRLLQRCGLILSRPQHQRHHSAPFAQNYCITTGWCNGPLTACSFFPTLERLVTRLTGAVPRREDQAFTLTAAEERA